MSTMNLDMNISYIEIWTGISMFSTVFDKKKEVPFKMNPSFLELFKMFFFFSYVCNYPKFNKLFVWLES